MDLVKSVQIGPLEPVGPLKMDRFGPAKTKKTSTKCAKLDEK
jgi:hypothetical protein